MDVWTCGRVDVWTCGRPGPVRGSEVHLRA